jgi:hypothetical protein
VSKKTLELFSYNTKIYLCIDSSEFVCTQAVQESTLSSFYFFAHRSIVFFGPLYTREECVMIHGDLTLGTSRIGTRVRCVVVPDISFWQKLAKNQSFSLPSVGKDYFIRSNVSMPVTFNGPYQRGVLLSFRRADNTLVPLNNPSVTHLGDSKGEPFFLFKCFMLLGNRP